MDLCQHLDDCSKKMIFPRSLFALWRQSRLPANANQCDNMTQLVTVLDLHKQLRRQTPAGANPPETPNQSDKPAG